MLLFGGCVMETSVCQCEKVDTNFITVLRLLCCIQVFLIHYFVRIGLRDYVGIFCGAVPCFLYMSAFLYGINKQKLDGVGFFKKRWLSLSSTYYPFLLFAFLYILIWFSLTDQYIDLKSMILGMVCSIFFLPDVKTIPECGHLWFIQTLVVCYVVLWTCKKNKFIKKIFESHYWIMLVVVLLLLSSFLYRGPITVYVCCYLWMFYNTDKMKNYVKEKCDNWIVTLVHVAVLLICYSLYLLVDVNAFSQWVYFRYWLASIIGIETIVLFMMIFKLQKIRRLNNIIMFGASISMEIYLVHHLFVFYYPLYLSLPLTVGLTIVLKKVGLRFRNFFNREKGT